MEDRAAEEKEQKEAFIIFDSDKDGKLSKEEATYAFMALGYSFSEEEMNDIMNKYGQNDIINFENFSYFLFNRSKDIEMEDELMECFKDIDKDHDGKISNKDLKYLLFSIGEKLNDEEINEIIKQTDTTGEGFINYRDMIKLMLQK